MPSSDPPQEGNNHAPAAKPFSLFLSASSASNGASKKPTSFNLQPSSRPTPESGSRTLPRRPHQLHHGSDSEDDDGAPVHEAVTGFDTHTGTTISAEPKPEKRDLVIPVTSRNNWRDRPGVNIRRVRKNLLPREVQALQQARERGEDVTGEGKTDGSSVKYGISYAEPRADEGNQGDKEMKDAEPLARPVVDEGRPLTQDEIALQALVRESKGDGERRSDLVIQASSTPGDEGEVDSGVRYDETGTFRADIASRPESASLDQYNAIPVEEFGAALLRGMGWKEGQSVGRGNYDTSATAKKSSAPRIPERRPGFLGIGAKDLSGGRGAESEIGAWGKAAMRKGSRKSGAKGGGDSNTEGVYMPVLMRNKQTGEYITEEELAAARKEAKGNKDDNSWKERRDRNLERSGRDRDRDREYRRRDYENGDDYDGRRSGSSRRERSLSAVDRHSRRRRHDDDSYSSGRDDRSYRDKDRERARRRDRERDRDSDSSRKYRDDDRYGSRHSSSQSSRRRDRDRDSDRDSHRRRYDR